MTDLPELHFERLVKIGGSYSLVIPKAFINHGLIDPAQPLKVKISQNKARTGSLLIGTLDTDDLLSVGFFGALRAEQFAT